MNKEKLVQYSVLLLRLVSALLFVEVGGLKLFGWFGGMPNGMPLPPLLLVAGVLEVFGGLAIALGLFTRPVAFLLSGEMAVAYFIGHVFGQMPPYRGHVLVPMLNQGQPAVLLCFIFLFFAAYGGGEFSFDALYKKFKKSSPSS